MFRHGLTVGLITKNEEFLLPYCLRSIRKIADEIIVIDTGSTDRTIQIAAEFGARVYGHKWRGNFSAARNEYLRRARYSWIMTMDADETLSPSDALRARRLIGGNADAYEFDRRYYTSSVNWFLQWHPNDKKYPKEEGRSERSGFNYSFPVRLFRNGYLYDRRVRVHENIRHTVEREGGSIRHADITIHDFASLRSDTFNFDKNIAYYRLGLRDRRERDLTSHELCNLALYAFTIDKDTGSSVRSLKAALKRAPRWHYPNYLLGLIYREMGKPSTALRYLRAATTDNPGYADALWLNGVCLDETGRSAEAERWILRALKAVPRHAIYLNSLGVVYHHLGKAAAATRALKRSHRLLKEYPFSAENLSILGAGRP